MKNKIIQKDKSWEFKSPAQKICKVYKSLPYNSSWESVSTYENLINEEFFGEIEKGLNLEKLKKYGFGYAVRHRKYFGLTGSTGQRLWLKHRQN